jgi:hypothetical protein
VNTDVGGLDDILAVQFLVAWAGEKRSKPPRFGWWDTDLVDEAGGGDLLARLAPRTHAWAALEAVREAARRVDAKARERHGEPDRLRTIFFLGFELDEKLGDRLAAHKRGARPPVEILPLPFALGGEFPRESVIAALAPAGAPAFEKVPPVGRQLKGQAPGAAAALVRALAAALVPPADEYPMPFFRMGT